MMDLWPHLLRPFWLLILPLPLWLLWHLWHRQRQAGSWQRLLPVAFHDTLLTGGRVRNSRLPWLALGGAWLLTWLALLGPSWQQLEQPSLKRAAPLVVLLEMTPAMLAGDLQPTRLQHARHKVLDLLRLRQDAQTAVVVFAGSAHTLVPLSDDLATTENLLDAIRPELMPEEGHRADLAVAQALALLEQGAQGRGQLLLIGSTLAAEEQAGIASLLAGSGWRLSILGIGTEQGAPIAQQDGGFLKDAQGAILIPQLDAKGLQRFANELGGRYQPASLDDADLLALGLHEASNAVIQASEATQLSVWLDQGHWLLLPLLVLAACAARRGWLFCLPLLLLVPPPAQALEFDDLWLRPDQQGQRLLEAQRPADAAQRFENSRWQGFAHYQAGDYAAAARLFAEGDSAADHYNRGNALVHGDKLEEAIEAYDQALELQPDLDAARQNRAIAEVLLRQRQTEQNDEAQQAPEESSQPEQSDPATAPPSSNSSAAQSQPTEGEGKQSEQNASAPPAVEPQPGEDPSLPAPPEQVSTLTEQRQATDQWLRQIPDDPGELLRRKFLLEQRKRQETNR
ncbi:VWA domain-containing protein [Stutzerimonas nitrititolerans]|uniref:VWA domain-containing protein n=1 Tax=Stutzerimonas nitrititolerans TaxID=2482751 RepID=UPI0028B19EF7|nr:VWA domain-containing protein [Stutzerimonas nitrititolerans]